MKKLIGVAVFLGIIVIGGLAILRFVDFNQLGAQTYYVQITDDGKVEKTTIDTGEVFETYWYNDYKIYNDKGESQVVNFSAQKNLRQGAYLKVYYKDNKGITSYEEVQEADVPAKAKEQM
ncbi:YxeA family protein [Metalysinibacillus jejuensis]|uniref:YxeA family protein n=1 Tax=Metalysinibacillus jejuensis TaxID=914327 RepID=UPI000D3A733D|nr:YxeA family protein [Metalysinibacillus jejuensis]